MGVPPESQLQRQQVSNDIKKKQNLKDHLCEKMEQGQ